jgi:outer membrane autotransporter protein
VQAGALLSIPVASALGSGTLQLFGTGAGPATLAVTGNTSIANAVQVTGVADWSIGPSLLATVAGVISNGTSPGGIEVSGGGTLNLTAANTYTGATTIDAGATLTTVGAASIAASSGVTANGTFDVSGASSGPTITSLAGTGAVTLGAQTLSVTQAAGTFAGGIGGTGGVAITGGNETLTGTSSYTGSTAIAPGATLAVAGAGTIAASSGVTANGTFDISGANGGVTINSLGGTGVVTLGAQTLALANAADTFSGVIGGTGGLAVNGGIETLTGANSFTGGTSVNGAVLAVNSDAALGAPTGGLALSNGTLNALASLSSARAVTLAGSNTIGTGGNTVTLSGIAAGSGGLILTGGGLVTLSGTNTYTGGTVVTGGSTLAIANDTALGGAAGSLSLDAGNLQSLANIASARAINVDAGGGTLNANGNALALSGPIALNGALTVAGSGSVSFSNQAQGRGTLTIANGLFSNNGQITGQSLTVNAPATLRGIGTIAAPTSVYGTLAPGNSPGTLTFQAPVTLAPRSVTEFDIDGTGTGTGAGNYSRVLVQGPGNALTANGTLEPLLRGITGSATNSYVPPVGQIYNVISATGGVGGSFSGLTQPVGLAVGTKFDTIYGANTVNLVITPTSYGNLGTLGVTQTPAQAAAGAAVDSARPDAGVRVSTALAPLLYPLYTTPVAALAPALGELAPVIYADTLTIEREGWYQMADTVADQIAARRGDFVTPSAAQIDHGLTLWVSGIGGLSRVNSTDAPGFSGTIAGGAVGADKAFAPGLIAGVAIGGLSTTVSSADGARAWGEQGEVMIYGGWQKGIAFVDGQASYGIGNQDVRRYLTNWGTSSQGGANVKDGGAQIHAGLHLQTEDFVLEPLIGFSAFNVSNSALTETALGEHVGGGSATSISSLLGFRVGHSFALPTGRPLTATALVGWDHEYDDKPSQAYASFGTGAAFAFTGVPGSRDRARVGGGVSLAMSERVSFSATYDALIAASGTSQRLMATARVSW